MQNNPWNFEPVNIADIDFLLFGYMVIIVFIVIMCICCTDSQRETTTDQDPEGMREPDTSNPIEHARLKYFQTIRPFQNVIQIPDSFLSKCGNVETIRFQKFLQKIMEIRYCMKCGSTLDIEELSEYIEQGQATIVCEFCDWSIEVKL